MILNFTSVLLLFILLGFPNSKLVEYENRYHQNLKNSTHLVINNGDSLSYPFRIITSEEFDNNNIKPYYIKFYDKSSNRELKTIDIINENPFVKSGLKIIKNDAPQGYFYYKAPGKGIKKDLKNIFGPTVFTKIPEDTQFDKMYFTYEVSEVHNQYIVISYKLDLDINYDERNGNGYQVTHIEVYDYVGNQIYKSMIDGGIHDKAILSGDGDYLTFFNVLDHYNEINIRTQFTIVNIRIDKIVFSEVYNNLFLDRCYSYLDNSKNIVISLATQMDKGDVICFFPMERRLYKTTTKIIGLYTFHNMVEDEVIVGFRDRPTEKLNLHRDFTEIQLKQ